MNFQNVEFLISAAAPKDFPKNRLPEIAFAGKSNVGKSSVINRVLQRKNFARVGEKPGKTIHVNYFTVDKKCYLVDLPGYGFARRSPDEKKAWSLLTDSYFVKNPCIDTLKAVCQLIDIRVGPTDDDIMMINYLIDARLPFFIVATKCDKLSPTAVKKTLAEWEEAYFKGTSIKVIPYSSVTGLGKEQVWDEIFSRIRK